jgi:adenylate cyclase
MAFDLAPYVAAGLHDPTASDATERAELIEYLAGQGCTVEEMLAADARGRLFALGGDRIVRPQRDTYSLRQVADQLGADVALVQRVWRALGLVATGPDEPVASPTDVTTVGTLLNVVAFLGEEVVLGTARVFGSSLARIAEAMSGATRGRVSALSIEGSGSEVVTARTWTQLAAIIPAVGAALDAVFRHHLESARMMFELSDSYEVATDGGINVGIGFADLSGFTDLTQRMTLAELSGLLGAFEAVAMEVVGDHGGRVVKLIGDAVMYVTPIPQMSVDIAHALLGAAREAGLVARAGLSAGTVLALDGDFFGPVVNAAARLVAVADPGEILATHDLVRRMDSSERAVSLGPRALRGFDEPVEIYRLAVAD